MKLDILAFGAHPDDIELSCSGTLIQHIKAGSKVGLVDITRGELGTRGTPEIRNAEATEATKILGAHTRENLNLEDCFFTNDRESRLEVAKVIRKYQPDIVIANAVSDRHPDHGRAAELVSAAVFIAGLVKVESTLARQRQDAWKVKAVYHYIQDRYIKPDFAIDITDVWETKMQCMKAFKSQFYKPGSDEPETAISSKEFFEFLHGRALDFGRSIGVKYAEGFTVERTPGLKSLFDLI